MASEDHQVATKACSTRHAYFDFDLYFDLYCKIFLIFFETASRFIHLENKNMSNINNITN